MIITDLGMNGEGIAHDQGRTHFVPYALVGENVGCIFDRYIVSKSSPDRVEPKCPYFEKCGGCVLQHLAYEKELIFKSQLVSRTIKKIAGMDIECLPTKTADEYLYRNKIALPVGSINGEYKVGMYARSSHNLVAITDCVITKPFAKNVISLSNDFLHNTNAKDIRYIVARESEYGLVLTIVATRNIKNANYLSNKLQTKFDNFALYLCINKNPKTILNDNLTLLSGDKHLPKPDSFAQVNDQVSEMLYNNVLSEIDAKDVVIDAYSGAGKMTMMFAKVAHHVYGIEIVQNAVNQANDFMVKNNISNVTNICGDCAKVLPDLIKKQTGKTTIVLDPPRAGCDSRVLSAIISAKVDKIVYVSCNPKTLARDLKLLADCYDIKYIQPYNMFPRTEHVESLVVLERK